MSARAVRAAMALLVFLSGLATVGGCGALPRHAIPKDKLEAAQIPGISDARFWGDVHNPRIETAFVQSIERERVAMGLSSAAELPDAHFLALSGGGSNGAFGAGLLCGWTRHGDRPTF